MSSSVVSVSASQRPRLHVAPRADETFGDLASDFADAYGLTPDPWQRLVLDDWLARAGGRWASLSCGLSCPRQNGKNGIVEVRELFGMVGRGERILHTAHEVKTARKAFKRLQFFFGRQVGDRAAKFPELNARVVELRNVNGQEAIFLDNGGSVEIIARSKNSGRGFTADVLIMDEAQEMSDDDIEALMPTTSAAPLGDPQWIFTGTPPGPKVNGEVFTRTRSSALAENPRSCWHEWSACDPGEVPDLDSPEVWALNNPGMDVGRLQIEVVEGERAQFTAEGFARERLGVWDPPLTDAKWLVVSQAEWTLCKRDEHTPSGSLAYALDVDTNKAGEEWCSIAASDGTHLEVVTPPEAGPGLAWVVAKVVEKKAAGAFTELVLDDKGPAGKLVQPLEAAGIKVRKVKPDEFIQACGQLVDAVTQRAVVHLGQPVLDRAVAGATRRDVGDGAWRLSRTLSTVDIGPMVAVALARWAGKQPAQAPAGFKDLADYLDD